MKRNTLLILAMAASTAQALNIAPVSRENMARFEEGLKFAKANQIEYVRFNDAMPGATHTDKLDVSAHIEAGRLCRKYGRKVVFLSYIQMPNSRYWRAAFRAGLPKDRPLQPDFDKALWTRWTEDEKRGRFQDLKGSRGIYPELWKPAVETSQKLYDAFCRGYGSQVIRQIDNEPGNVLDARLAQDIAYGELSKPIRDFFAYWVPKAKGPLCSPSWETQSKEGLSRQMRAESMLDWTTFKYQSINWYLTPWRQGDTPESWAKRCAAEFESLMKWEWRPIRNVVISELGAIGAPKNHRLECYRQFMRFKPKNVVAVAWYDFDSGDWGLK